MYSNIKLQSDYWLSILYDNIYAKKGIYVLGYTKSGTNWIRNLIRQYYEIDLDAEKSNFYRKRVHHLHRFLPFPYYKKKLVYMVRDGRDAIVSRYFSMVNQPRQSKLKKDFTLHTKQIPTTDNIKELLPSFIEFLKTYHKSSLDYTTHLNRALNENLFIIKYEDLQQDTEETLKKVIKHLTPNSQIDDCKVEDVVKFCSFEKSKKRHETNRGFFRKDGGKSGTWKNYFSEESAKIFCEYANHILTHFNYEVDSNWVKEFEANKTL